MNSISSVTDAEWHVMKVLWDRPREWLRAADVVERVVRERRVHHRTVRTLLARLVKKGAVEAKTVGEGGEGPGRGGGFFYQATLAREAVIRQESRTFLSRVFEGNVAPALVHLLQESRQKLSPEDIDKLRDLLDKKGRS